MRVTVTGATGLIGKALVAELLRRGDEVTVLTRDPTRAVRRLGGEGAAAVQALAWAGQEGPAPASALAGRDAVVNLAGENIARRWSESAKREIRDSRVLGTRNLVAGLERVQAEGQRIPGVLVSSSAVGRYGAHGEEPLDEEAPASEEFLGRLCGAWEAEAQRASALGLRVVLVRTGVVLAGEGGALAKMLPAFRLGLGGPIAGGSQYVAWVHRDDVVGMILAALEDERWRGPVNATAPEPATNREFAHALGRVLRRPALLPLPATALRLLYGEMSEVLTTGARAVPARPLVLGYEFRHPRLEPALRAALAAGSRSR